MTTMMGLEMQMGLEPHCFFFSFFSLNAYIDYGYNHYHSTTLGTWHSDGHTPPTPTSGVGREMTGQGLETHPRLERVCFFFFLLNFTIIIDR
jgi:hypothetical protein